MIFLIDSQNFAYIHASKLTEFEDSIIQAFTK